MVTWSAGVALGTRDIPRSLSAGPCATCQVKLHHDHVDQRGYRRASGLDHVMSRLPVERVSLVVQGVETAQGIFDLQKGPALVMAHPAKHFVRSRLQVEDQPRFT